jgi:uncharacterized protein (TIGR03435 family)
MALIGLIIAAVAMTPLDAQSFDVASVKANPAGPSWSTVAPRLRNGTCTATNVSLRILLSAAYDVPPFEIVGPAWIDSAMFDILARSPKGVPDTQMGPMLQALLKDRFLAAVHRETRELPSYEMIAAKNGVKLQRFDPEHRPVVPQHSVGSVLVMMGRTMPEIAIAFSFRAGRPVVDRTGMKGSFYLYLNYTPLSAQSPTGSPSQWEPPDFLTAVQEQLGLTLRPKKELINVLVVDHAARVPTAN